MSRSITPLRLNIAEGAVNAADVQRLNTMLKEIDQFLTAKFNARGTVGAPSLVGDFDVDSGRWSPGDDILAWSTGGTERMRVSSAGLVLTVGFSTTSITLSAQNAITFTHATAEIIPGATSLTFRNSADSLSNVIIADSGEITFRAGLSGITTLGMSGVATLSGTAAGTLLVGNQSGSGNIGVVSVGGGINMVGTGVATGLRVYPSTGTHQWDIYLNSTNLRLSDNTGGGTFVVDTAMTVGTVNSQTITSSANFTGSMTVGTTLTVNSTGASAISVAGGITVGTTGSADDRGITFSQNWLVRRDNDVTGDLRFYHDSDIRFSITSAGALTTGTVNGQTISTTANFTGTGAAAVNIVGGLTVGSSGSTDDRGITFTQDWVVRRDNDTTGDLWFINGGNNRVTISSAGVVTLTATAAGTLLVGNQSGATTADTVKIGGGVALLGTGVAGGLRVYGSSGTHQWDVYLNSTNLRIDDNTGGGVVNITAGLTVGGTTTLTPGAFAAGDKYLVVTAGGVVHVSTLGPVS